ncbi:MSC_0623 family F1-like ATPase-associated protein [[Mycoplasma] anseris]|uniref:DUF2714 domain-containing protein n=1 Tax=[Mycoplasma] anseris TaxID=92400 RepID=A0A2Z4NCV5_9BACT|nr:DUF2714 domain-containing protein [[Mycoplasma] anseris]AWX69392.1 DUF2714 domain-containing protein [[Mycoplasma] anseris]
MKCKQNKKEIQELEAYKKQVFQNWDEIILKPNFVSFEAFNNQFFVMNNLNKEEAEYHKFIKELKANLDAKNDICFTKFVIHFTRDLRFSLTDLVPEVKLVEASNVISFYAYDLKDLRSIKNRFQELFYTLINNGFIVEIVPNIAIFQSKEVNKTKLVFGSDLLYNEPKEN